MDLTTPAFVIGKEELGEADAVLTLYTQDLGKIGAVARGYRKMASKLRPALVLFSQNHVSLHARLNQTFLVTGAEAVDLYTALRQNPQSLRLALISVSVFDDLVVQSERDEQLWTALSEYFSTLSEAVNAPNNHLELKLVTISFLLTAAKLLGIQPQFDRCCECGKAAPDASRKMNDAWYFNEESGGVLCAVCAQTRFTLAAPILTSFFSVLDAVYKGMPHNFSVRDIDEALSCVIRFLRWQR